MKRDQRESHNEALYESLRTGDRDARDKLIVANFDLPEKLARKFVKQVESAAHLEDDLASEGNVALIRAIDELANVDWKGGSIREYLSKAIFRAMSQCVQNEEQVAPTDRHQRRLRNDYQKRLDELEAMLDTGVISQDTYDFEVQELERVNSTGVLKRHELTEVNVGTYIDSGFDLVDIHEAIDVACKDDTDRKIIAMRADGKIDAEIGIVLALSGETVRLRRHAIEARFNDTEQPNCTPAAKPSENKPTNNLTLAL